MKKPNRALKEYFDNFRGSQMKQNYFSSHAL